MTDEILERAVDIKSNIRQIDEYLQILKPYLHKRIEITIEAGDVKPTKIVEHNNYTTDGPYMAASIYKVLSDEKSKLEQDFKNLAHDESNIKMLDSQRSNVTKKILKPYMSSNLITSIFNK